VTFADALDEPFRSDPDFARSVAASADGLVAVVVAVVLTAVFGAIGALAFLLPVGLFVVAGVTGRRSARRSRAAVGDARTWRDAERRAVAAVFVRALLRRRWA
jgi:hypothetical protein